jgi:hypothetical protein
MMWIERGDDDLADIARHYGITDARSDDLKNQILVDHHALPRPGLECDQAQVRGAERLIGVDAARLDFLLQRSWKRCARHQRALDRGDVALGAIGCIPTELRRLAADIQNAIKTMPAELTDKLPISGSSAPFQVTKEQEGGPGFLQRGPSGIRVTLNNVPLAMCRLALLSGPKTFGMDAFELPGGELVSSLQIGSAPAALCTRMKGHLVMHRS